MQTQTVVDWSAPGLEARCDALRSSCLARGVPRLSVEAVWPGGPENAVTDPLGTWIVCYGNLMALFRHAEERQLVGRDQMDATLAAALARAPVAVTLASGEAVAVYPKSYHALRWLDTLDRSLQDAARAVDEAEQLGAYIAFPLVESLAVRLWAWILTSEAPDLPFNEVAPEEPPAWTRALAPSDLLHLASAHLQVNGSRLRLIADAFPPERRDDGTSRLSLAGFLGSTAQEMGVPAFDVMRRFSLGELFAQAVLAGQAAREAQARAKAQPPESAA